MPMSGALVQLPHAIMVRTGRFVSATFASVIRAPRSKSVPPSRNGRGRMGTMMDGPAVALDSGSAFQAWLGRKSRCLVGRKVAVSEQIATERRIRCTSRKIQRIELVVCDGVGSRARSNEVRRSLLQWRSEAALAVR